MKVLLVNKFLYPKGGDAISTLTTGSLLSSKGHKVSFWGMDHPSNPEYPLKRCFVKHVDFNNPYKKQNQLKAALNILYSFEAKRKMEEVIKIEKPDIVHLNNFAHQISPSILHVFRKHHIPVVMTMRDYKLVCPVHSMLREGKPCEKCKGGRYHHCFLNNCTKNSRVKSLINILEMYLHHKILHIYDLVDVYISPSRFLKSKVEEMGLKGKVVHLFNFVSLDDCRPQYEFIEKSIVYAGRLSHEKGLFTLIEAMKGLDVKLKIIGDGPLMQGLGDRVAGLGLKNVEFLGYKTGEEFKNEIKKSMFVVLPSECYENNPRSVIESFALGKPVVGAQIGGIPELVKDGKTGLTFEAGNVGDLRSKIETLLLNTENIVSMGRNARAFVEKEFNSETHYVRLLDIYQQAKIHQERRSV